MSNIFEKAPVENRRLNVGCFAGCRPAVLTWKTCGTIDGWFLVVIRLNSRVVVRFIKIPFSVERLWQRGL